jgi:hypothetical protein
VRIPTSREFQDFSLAAYLNEYWKILGERVSAMKY